MDVHVRTRSILDRLGDSIADAGRYLIRTFLDRAEGPPADDWQGRVEGLCDHILSGAGTASTLASVREIGNIYARLEASDRYAFLELLNDRYTVDQACLDAAIDNWKQAGDPAAARKAFLTLVEAVETPRQKVLRAVNMAPEGTRLLVEMRADVLGQLRQRPELELIEADLRHLLASWFNRGFLELRRIAWTTPAAVLERLFEYETVHQIENWDDLKRRLQSDRRIFAFFHPALPDDPLIFVEVALVMGITDSIQDLLNEGPQLTPAEADTAIFYSINSTQPGLRGISFGHFLIKQVLDDLQAEFPDLNTFATLSPLPRLKEALDTGLKGGEDHPLSRTRVANLLRDEEAEILCKSVGSEDPVDGLSRLLDGEEAPIADEEGEGPSLHRVLSSLLTRLSLIYLTEMKRGREAFDPVARFHLSNGARVERIVPFADTSPAGMRTACGVMVNYLYDPGELERTHEAYIAQGKIVLSPDLARQHKAIQKAEAP